MTRLNTVVDQLVRGDASDSDALIRSYKSCALIVNSDPVQVST